MTTKITILRFTVEQSICKTTKNGTPETTETHWEVIYQTLGTVLPHFQITRRGLRMHLAARRVLLKNIEEFLNEVRHSLSSFKICY